MESLLLLILLFLALLNALVLFYLCYRVSLLRIDLKRYVSNLDKLASSLYIEIDNMRKP